MLEEECVLLLGLPGKLDMLGAGGLWLAATHDLSAPAFAFPLFKAVGTRFAILYS